MYELGGRSLRLLWVIYINAPCHRRLRTNRLHFYSYDLPGGHQGALRLDLIHAPLRDIVMVLVEPTAVDPKIVRHLVEVLDRIWPAHKVPTIIAEILQHCY